MSKVIVKKQKGGKLEGIKIKTMYVEIVTTDKAELTWDGLGRIFVCTGVARKLIL